MSEELMTADLSGVLHQEVTDSLPEETEEKLEEHFEQLAREKGIKIIFYQEDIDGRQSRTFAEELGGRAEKVSPMATDYVENLQRMARAFAAGLK